MLPRPPVHWLHGLRCILCCASPVTCCSSGCSTCSTSSAALLERALMSLLRGPERYPDRAPEASRLENYANNASPLTDSDSRRGLRFARREVLWKVSDLKRVRHCGRVPRSNDELIALRLTEGHAGFAGLQHCGSVWADPVCAGRVLLHRALEIGAVLGRAIESGYSLGFVTFTMRHHSAQPLELLWAAGQGGWRRVTSGKVWQRTLGRIVGFVRVWEVNYGANGWHVHVHCVLVLERGSDLDEIASGMFNRWSRGL